MNRVGGSLFFCGEPGAWFRIRIDGWDKVHAAHTRTGPRGSGPVRFRNSPLAQALVQNMNQYRFTLELDSSEVCDTARALLGGKALVCIHALIRIERGLGLRHRRFLDSTESPMVLNS